MEDLGESQVEGDDSVVWWTESAEPPSVLKMRKSYSRPFRTSFFSLNHLGMVMWEIKLKHPHDKLSRCLSATLACEVPVKSVPLAELNKA